MTDDDPARRTDGGGSDNADAGGTEHASDGGPGGPTPETTGTASMGPGGAAAGGEPSFADAVSLLADSVGHPMVALDASGTVLAWNSRLAGLTGISEDDAVGSPDVGALLRPGGGPTPAEELLETDPPLGEAPVQGSGGQRMTDADRIVDDEGTEQAVSFTATPHYRDGELVGVVQTVVEREDTPPGGEDSGGAVSEAGPGAQEDGEADAGAGAEPVDQEAVAREVGGAIEAFRTGGEHDRVEFAVETAETLDDDLVAVLEVELNALLDEVDEFVESVAAEVDALADGVDDLAVDAEVVSDDIDDQTDLLARSVQETQRLSGRMDDVATTAAEVDEAAGLANDLATEGARLSADTRETTERLNETGDELVSDIEAVNEGMSGIEEVVDIIADIADQTNVLALNANIEAARAGSGNEGFAVVADEIKTLSDETQEHTDEITATIDSLRTQTDDAVDSARAAQERIDETDERIAELVETFEEIAAAVADAADGIADVSDANTEQAAAIEEVTTSIEEAQAICETVSMTTDGLVAGTDTQADRLEQLAAAVEDIRADEE